LIFRPGVFESNGARTISRWAIRGVAGVLLSIGGQVAGPADDHQAGGTARSDAAALPLVGTQRVEFTTDEATWLSVDVSPAGSLLVFSILGDLYTLPIEGGTATRISSGVALDTQPRFSPDGLSIVFVSDRRGSENLWALDVGSAIDDATPESAATGLRAITRGRDASYASPEWSSDGNRVVASKTDRFTWIDVDHSVWIHNVDDGSGEQLQVRGEPVHGMGAAFGPDGSLYVAHRRPGGGPFAHQISRFDLETGELVEVASQPGGAIRPALSPDGRWLVYGSRHDGRTGYRLRDLTADTEQWLTYPVQHDLQENNWMGTSSDHLPGYDFTPDSSAIITSIDGKIYRVDVPSGERTLIPFEANVALDIVELVHFNERVPDGPVQLRQIRNPSLSPDGSKLAFTAVHRLFVRDLVSGRTIGLGEMQDLQAAPAWSHDGNWLAFVSWSDFEGGQLWKIRADGSSLQQLSRLPAFYTDPVWTPGDDEILVAKGPWQQRGRRMEWNRMPASGGDPVRVAAVTGSRPHFANDPDRFYTYEGAGGLVSMRLDGGDRRVEVRVFGQRPPLGPGGAQPADDVLMGPDGENALVLADYQVYRVGVPNDPPQSISVFEPAAGINVEKLSRLGGEYMSWGPGGGEATWALGNTLFRYRFADAASSDAYAPEELEVEMQFPRDKPSGTLVLRGGRLLTMDPELPDDGIIENGAIVVVDNRIARVGRSADILTPPGAREVDVSGTTVLPGFIDLHAHTRPALGIHRNVGWDYLNYLAFGVTTARNPAESTEAQTYHDLVEIGAFIGPRLFSTGEPILNNNDIRSLDDALDVVRRYHEYYGYNTIKQYLSGDRTTRQWMSMAARQIGVTPTTEGIDMKTMITQVMDGFSLEHLLPHFPLYKDVVELMAASGSFYDATLVVGTGPRAEYYWWTRTDVHDDAKVRRFTPHDILDRATRRTDWYIDDDFYFVEHAKDLEKIVAAGGKVTVGSHGEMQGISYHWEIWNIQSGGMDELDALRAATLFGAQGIGFEQDLGSITEGKLADILVLNEDPLDDIRKTTSLRWVMKNGVLYDADTLDTVWPVERKLPRMYWQGSDPVERR